MPPAGEMWSVVIEFEEQPEDARALDVGDGRGRGRHAGEVRRVLHIGRALVPAVGLPALDLDLAPFRIAAEHVAVALLEHRLLHRLAHHLGDLLGRRPDVLEIDGRAVGAGAERLGGEIDRHRAGQRVGHHQRRRGEIVGAHVVIDAALEIAIARQAPRRPRDDARGWCARSPRAAVPNCRCRWCSHSRRD